MLYYRSREEYVENDNSHGVLVLGKNEQVGSPFDLGLITENDKGIPS